MGRPRVGIGQFAGSVDPADLTGAVGRELITGMTGDPGLRLAPAMAARGRRYYGTSFTVQQYVRPHGGVNTQAALEASLAAPMKRNRSRALGQHRGLPWMSQEFLDA